VKRSNNSPANAELAASSLPNSLTVTLPNHGHINLIRGCIPELVRQFIDRGEMDIEYHVHGKPGCSTIFP
jgi:hypothetical protein